MQDPLTARPAHTGRLRVLVLGATGTVGRATVAALVGRGHEAVCVLRPRPPGQAPPALAPGAVRREAEVTCPRALARDGLRGERFDALLSCMASRNGAEDDAWAIDYRAHSDALALARDAGIGHMVLLSAICVQKPRLAFQHAKRAFEAELIASGVDYSIVRPTALFKSLSGQVERVRRGKRFLVFGDGALTACKPISDADLADYMVDCLERVDRRNRVLPIGGPGPAITPRAQGEMLFDLIGRPPRFRHVPLALLDGIIAGLDLGGRLAPRLRARADFARIGRYYATESMLVMDPQTGRYDADATPQTGRDTLRAHYARMLRGEAGDDRGAHAVF